MTDPQTEARASLWVPAKPEHAKLGWTYDFEQTERISRAAYESTGYDTTMEVVEFVMTEADRRHATALAAKDAELENSVKMIVHLQAEIVRVKKRAEAQLAAKDANIKMLGEQMVTERLHGYELLERAERAEAQLAEAQLAEARKALDRIIALDSSIDATPRGERKVVYGTFAAIARRAREAQGGE